jgi:hypothetical protein
MMKIKPGYTHRFASGFEVIYVILRLIIKLPTAKVAKPDAWIPRKASLLPRQPCQRSEVIPIKAIVTCPSFPNEDGRINCDEISLSLVPFPGQISRYKSAFDDEAEGKAAGCGSHEDSEWKVVNGRSPGEKPAIALVGTTIGSSETSGVVLSCAFAVDGKDYHRGWARNFNTNSSTTILAASVNNSINFNE